MLRAYRPLSEHCSVSLLSKTDSRWLPLALEHFDAVLIDHAHCEKKAAANALSLLQAYPEVPGLPAQMARLAREESAHLARVIDLIEQRGMTLTYDKGDPYARALQSLVRKTSPQRRLDHLLVAAIIEARSCERLALLASGLEEPGLRKFYAELAQSEDGHQELFYRLALECNDAEVTRLRLHELLVAETGILAELPIRPAIH